jgi:hypothetical protein
MRNTPVSLSSDQLRLSPHSPLFSNGSALTQKEDAIARAIIIHTTLKATTDLFIYSLTTEIFSVLIISHRCKSVLAVKLKVCKQAFYTDKAEPQSSFFLRRSIAGIFISDIRPIERSATERKASLGQRTDKATAQT